jgi:hypothetical protein
MKRMVGAQGKRPPAAPRMIDIAQSYNVSHSTISRLGAIACSSAHRPLPLSSRDNL